MCRNIDGGSACVVTIDVPEKLGNWELFLESYDRGVGKAIKFVKNNNCWIKQEAVENWSVERWSAVSTQNLLIHF